MNKQEYMRQLEIKLKRLPKDDFERAIEYYEEYFAEAGEEHEQKAIEDLGSPQEAADQIIKDFALNYSKEPVKDVKSGMNALWVGVLALFAAPLALPLMAGRDRSVFCNGYSSTVTSCGTGADGSEHGAYRAVFNYCRIYVHYKECPGVSYLRWHGTSGHGSRIGTDLYRVCSLPQIYKLDIEKACRGDSERRKKQ